MYKLKSTARRAGSLLAAVGVVLGTFSSFAAPAFADALNPLTERSLTLSSSAPGWDNTDGSGNSTYAAPNSGANGQKTGNTFQFKVSTDSSSSNPVKGFSFQYCTAPAGTCSAPGNDGTTDNGDGTYTRGSDSAADHKSDLNVASSSPTQVDNSGNAFVDTDGNVVAIPNRNDSQGNFVILDNHTGSWAQSDGTWTMAVTNNEDGQQVGGGTTPGGDGSQVGDDALVTGKKNYITLTNATGLNLPAGTGVKVIFFGTDNNYITNPGEGAFFVKINDYKSDTSLTDANILDGGVTVANVMNLSIEIQTKVLETMSFSVGTVDPDTLNDSQLNTASDGKYTVHGICNPILGGMSPSDPQNTLLLGDENQENSLSTEHTFSTHSYFRLSSNASAGATVYYAGNTLSNTEGDKIAPIGATKQTPSIGTEQFGLALDETNKDQAPTGTPTNSNPNYAVDYSVERTSGHVFESGADNTASGILAGTGVDASVAADMSTASITTFKKPSLMVAIGDHDYDGNGATSLRPATNYNNGSGVVNGGEGYSHADDNTDHSVNTSFAFDPNSDHIPVPLASEDQSVVDCATGKIRYIGNIAATTPAGIYTTKVNYIAAPQY